MKRLSVLFMFLAFALGMNAQVEKVFDFNDYQVGSGQPYPPLNGQDGWYVRAHSDRRQRYYAHHQGQRFADGKRR